MVVIIFLCLFFYINTIFYLSIELLKIDDCISRIYTEDNETIFQYYNFSIGCSSKVNQYPNPLISTIPYQIGQKIFIDIYDNGGGAGFFSADVYLNEYIIRMKHQKFWTCTNCGGENYNYRYNVIGNRMDFYNYTLDTHIKKSKVFFIFIFK